MYKRQGQPHIFAAGDVIGFPGLAAASMEQGRRAALAAFGKASAAGTDLLPYGIYTIPEISFVGQGEGELTERAVPYVVGLAGYRELARGEIAGDRAGVLKLLVHLETRAVLGVHIFGTAATELVHLGQTAIAGGLGVDYLSEAVFNVPTFTDAYKVAALDARDRLDEIRRPSAGPSVLAADLHPQAADAVEADPDAGRVLGNPHQGVVAVRAAEHDARAPVGAEGPEGLAGAAFRAPAARDGHVRAEHLQQDAGDRVAVEHQLVHVTPPWVRSARS